MHTDGRRLLLAILVLLPLTALVHTGCFNVPFLYDDKYNIREIAELGHARYLPLLFSKEYYARFQERTWRPVMTLTFFADRALWGEDEKRSAAGFHLTNFLLHLVTTLLVFGVAWEFFGGGVGPLIAALLYGVHPAHVETLSVIVNRKELLGGLFFFLAFWLYARSPKLSAARAAGILLSFVLGMLSIEMTATLPAALILYVMCAAPPGERAARLRRHAPLYAAMFAVVGLHAAFFLYGPMRNPLGGAQWPGGGPAAAAGIMPRVFAEYARLLVWPRPLCMDYVFAPLPFLNARTLATGIFLVSYLVLAVAVHKKNPKATFMMLFLPLALAPVSNIIPFGGTMAERYLYIPSLAAALGFGWILAGISSRSRFIAALLFLGITTAFAFAAEQRYAVWQSEESLWRDTLGCAPNSSRARLNLGNVYYQGENYADALVEYRRAEACPSEKEFYKLHFAMASAERELGNVETAKQLFRRSISEYGGFLPAYKELARLLLDTRHPENAKAVFREAIRNNSDNAQAYHAAGQFLLRPGASRQDLAEAEKYLRRAVTLRPDYANAHGDLGQALTALRRWDDAEAEMREALRLDPGNPFAKPLLENIRRNKETRRRAPR